MLRALPLAGIMLICQAFGALAQDGDAAISQVPATAGVLVTLTGDGRLILTPSGLVELENGVQLQQDSAGHWAIGGTFIPLRELTANPFQYDGRRLTVTGGHVANVLPDYGFLQYSNLLDGGTVTVLTRGLPDPVLAPFTAGCTGFVTESIAICDVSILATVAVDQTDGTVELREPVFISR